MWAVHTLPWHAADSALSHARSIGGDPDGDDELTDRTERDADGPHGCLFHHQRGGGCAPAVPRFQKLSWLRPAVRPAPPIRLTSLSLHHNPCTRCSPHRYTTRALSPTIEGMLHLSCVQPCPSMSPHECKSDYCAVRWGLQDVQQAHAHRCRGWVDNPATTSRPSTAPHPRRTSRPRCVHPALPSSSALPPLHAPSP